MERYRDFTFDPQRYPVARLRALVDRWGCELVDQFGCGHAMERVCVERSI